MLDDTQGIGASISNGYFEVNCPCRSFQLA